MPRAESGLLVRRVAPLVLAAVAAAAALAPSTTWAQAQDQQGTVTISANLEVGTAITATLTDPDGSVTGTSWQWSRSAQPDTGFTNISGATTASYTPADGDHAHFLKATAAYTDGHGADKSAQGVTSRPVGVSRRQLVGNTLHPIQIVDTGVTNSIVYKLFGTGDNPAGYVLDRIRVRIRENTGDPRTAQLYKREQSPGVGSHFVDLAPEDPSTDLDKGGSPWLAPPPRTVLEADAIYLIRLTGVDRYVSAARGLAENTGGPPGWHISGNTVVHGPDDSFRSINNPLVIAVEGAELLGPPGAPLGAAAAAAGGEVTVLWNEPGSTGQRAVTKYRVRYKKTADANFGAWSDVADSDSGNDLDDERSTTIGSLDAGAEYTLQVRAVNSEGNGTEAETTSVEANSAPEFSATTATRTVAENTASGNVGAAMAATDADTGDVLAYSVAETSESGGSDHLADFNRDFELDPATGRISIRTGAMIDYETRSTYKVTYQVTDNKNIANQADDAIDDTLELTINVTNANDAGAVTFGADPAVGTKLTATLTDTDGSVTGTSWQWWRSKQPDTGFVNISATTASYTPADGDHAYFLKAIATYTDGHGAGKTAEGVTSLPVGVPRRLLVWNTLRTGWAADNFVDNGIVYKLFGTGDNPAGYVLDRIRVRLRRNTRDPVTAQLYKREQSPGVGRFFVDLAPDNPSTDLNSYGFHRLVPPPPGTVLEPDATYFVRLTGVRRYVGATPGLAQNAGGPPGWHISGDTVVHEPDDSFGHTDSPLLIIVEGAELLGPPGPPLGVSGAAEASSATVMWNEPGSTGHRAVSKYQVRYKKTADANFGAWSDVADSDNDNDLADERSATITSLDAGAEYTLQVRAVNSEGPGTEAETTSASTNSAPRFTGATATRTFPENLYGDVGKPITATEDDTGDTLTYSVAATSGGTADLTEFHQNFFLIAATGQIRTNLGGRLDHEARSTYELIYQVTDNKDDDGNADTTIDDTLMLTIYVTDVKENPRSEPTIDVGGGGGVGGRGGGGGGGVGGGGGEAEETAAARFADVDPQSVHAASIEALAAAAGITGGCASEPLRFCPDQPVTRAQMATFLVRALDLDPAGPDAPTFADVDPRSVHAASIEALAAAGITGGCASEPLRFCSDQPVTRAQMATFLTRALDL